MQAAVQRVVLPPGFVFDGLLDSQDEGIVHLTKEERREIIFSVIGKLYHFLISSIVESSRV